MSLPRRGGELRHQSMTRSLTLADLNNMSCREKGRKLRATSFNLGQHPSSWTTSYGNGSGLQFTRSQLAAANGAVDPATKADLQEVHYRLDFRSNHQAYESDYSRMTRLESTMKAFNATKSFTQTAGL
mmetsp:Transcript_29290/g.80192  ORF Transcript_29290/g.80192 Transcript_29290/m.80192 type:complete len:128 (-) Transcript_29290:172-555(-)